MDIKLSFVKYNNFNNTVIIRIKFYMNSKKRKTSVGANRFEVNIDLDFGLQNKMRQNISEN